MSLKREFEKQGNWLFRRRSYLPLTILLIAILLIVKVSNNKSLLEKCHQNFELFCLLVSIIGLIIRGYTVGYSAKNTSGRNTTEGQVADSLNTEGIYSVVRHPLYLGNYFMWLGLAMFTENLWFVIIFTLIYWLYYERIMFAEELFLERKFGECYEKWAYNVPAFIPDLGLFKHNQSNFSFKKIITKEKNGLLAMFLIFTFFDFLKERILMHTHYNYVFIMGLSISILLYIAVKIMRSISSKINDVLT